MQNTPIANTQAYDRIFKENIGAMLPNLTKSILQRRIFLGKDLPPDIQHTKERKPDFLKEMEDSKGNQSILHIECQTREDHQMAYRMAEYHIMLQRKYNRPVEQYVLFLGIPASRIKKTIKTCNFSFKYNIKNIIEIDYNKLLNSSTPEDKVFAILCNFKKEDPCAVIKQIIDGLRKVSSGLAYEKYIIQLSILSQLRDYKTFYQIIMNYEPRLAKERNPFYIGGFEEGNAKGKIETANQIAAKLKASGDDDRKIASVTGLSIQQIKELKVPMPGLT